MPGCRPRSASSVIVREFGGSPQTIGQVSGRLALDRLESFEYSRYYPTRYPVAAGQRTHFFYGFTDSECRRRGTMIRAQRK